MLLSWLDLAHITIARYNTSNYCNKVLYLHTEPGEWCIQRPWVCRPPETGIPRSHRARFIHLPRSKCCTPTHHRKLWSGTDDQLNKLSMFWSTSVKLCSNYLVASFVSPVWLKVIEVWLDLICQIATKATVRAGAFMGIGSLGELRISKNKIDRIEDFSLPNAVGKLVLKGNHILDIPSPRALANLDAERVLWQITVTLRAGYWRIFGR